MTRARLVAAVVVLCALPCLAVVGCDDATPATPEPQEEAPEPAEPPPRRPNVLLLVMDTTRRDRCSVHGYERPTTPFLEEFATDATVFDTAWSPAPWTGPSHASLFTGLRPARHGLRAGVSRHLSDERETLAESFKAAGYSTAAFVNAPPVARVFGFSQGFDVFRELFADRSWSHPRARETHAEAARWAERVHAAGEPFFLFVNDYDPHLPYRPVEEFGAQFVDAEFTPDEVRRGMEFEFIRALRHNLGLERTTERQDRVLSQLYDACIATLDAEIRTLFERLDAGGLLEDTIVVIVGDHGDNVGDQGLHDHQFSVHRGLLEVPLVIRAPGVFEGGTRHGEVVRLEDLHPTILELAGLAVPDGLDGESLTAPLDGRIARGQFGEPKVLLTDAARLFPGVDLTRQRRSLRSVFDGRHHLIVGSDGSVELYDLVEDRNETRDLSRERPDLVEQLRALAD